MPSGGSWGALRGKRWLTFAAALLVLLLLASEASIGDAAKPTKKTKKKLKARTRALFCEHHTRPPLSLRCCHEKPFRVEWGRVRGCRRSVSGCKLIFETNGLKGMCFQVIETIRFQRLVNLMSTCTALLLR